MKISNFSLFSTIFLILMATHPQEALSKCSVCEIDSGYRSKRVSEKDAREIFFLTNQVRRKYGLANLKYDVGGCKKMAQGHADFGARFSLKGDLHHHDFYKRVRKAGLTGKRVAENVVWQGASRGVDPFRAIRLWLNSFSHREEILNSRNKKLGVGVSMDAKGNTYWVQCFTN